MIDKEFIAHLSSTQADVRILNAKVVDAKQIKLKDKNILDHIKEAEFNSYDTRDPQLKNDELDIWNTEISLSEEGHIEVKPLEHSFETISSTQSTTLQSAVKVIDNEVLGENDTHLMYWQTDGLTNGNTMLGYCINLTSFSSDLSNLTGGYDMFSDCISLTSFSSDLSSLTDGSGMFYNCYELNSFSSVLSSLENGEWMLSDCSKLTTFTSDLPKMTNGYGMFYQCGALTSFSSDLSSLTDGKEMFALCILDAQSVANIVHTLPTHETSGIINIGIGCDATEEDQLLFAQECDCETWQELLDEFSTKNWGVTLSCHGRPTTTYNMRRGETLPIYAKLEEVIMSTDEKERKPHYQYTSQDGSKFYNINYFHSTNGSTEDYDVFSSLEEAISTYNVTPKN